MLSYMLPVEEKPPSATAAASRNLSLNLTTTTTSGGGGAGGGGGTATTSSQQGPPRESTSVEGAPSASQVGPTVGSTSTATAVVTRSIIKPTIKHNANYRYQLISGTVETATVGASRKHLGREQQLQQQQQTLLTGTADGRIQQQQRCKEDADVADLCDESTNLLAGDPGEREEDDDDDDDEDEGDDNNHGIDDRPAHGPRTNGASGRSVVKNDKNFNNLILVTNVMDLSESARAGGGGGGDASIGSDSDSVTGGGGGGSGGGGSGLTAGPTGGKKVKLNKLGGNKNVTLKRVSFGSSKGSMVETLVFETPTPLPEHAEREFFQSPAVLAGAGHTTMYSAACGNAAGPAPHLHYPASHPYHHPHHHHHHHHAAQQYQYHQQQQQQQGGYNPLDGGTGAGLQDDSGIELQEE
uniref:Uncharacterized protein n=1 Tax=Anopheles atroparvus TaxID=41427 RepID=A0A182IQA1_ANOAO